MTDYTATQVTVIDENNSLPRHDDSRALAQLAQAAYRERYGKRPMIIHVKGGSRQQWHFSTDFMYYVWKYPENITVFYTHDTPQGWATHKIIQAKWFDCGDGRCFKGPLQPMEEFCP